MTFSEDSYLDIRYEYPEIEYEVRAILIARAQTGASIAEIKEDYRNMTGLRFPVYKNITDFLLCIPGIVVYCNENGTRIFHVIPSEKTQHIHTMVLNQKPASNNSNYNNNDNSQSRTILQDLQNTIYYNNNNNNKNNNNNNNNSNSNSDGNNDKNVEKESEISSNVHSALNEFETTAHRHYGAVPNEQQQQQQQQQAHQFEYYIQPGMLMQQEINHCKNCFELQDQLMRLTEAESNGLAPRTNMSSTDNNCYYKDNYNYINDRISKQQSHQHPVHNQQNHNFAEYFNNNFNNNWPSIEVHTQQYRNSMPYQKQSLRLSPRQNSRTFSSSSPTSCARTKTTATSSSLESLSTESDFIAHLFDFILLGDDFFLYLARMELKCKFKKNEKVLQSGLCVSGQTIREAAKRIRRLCQQDAHHRSIIINIGSVDIMKGKSLVKIEHDFRQLIDIMMRRGFRPILTTLAPLANYGHDGSVKKMIERFNEFIKREGRYMQVIDIWSLFVNKSGQIFFDCYQSAPRNVSGTDEPYVFWNKIGRQRVLKQIETEIEY